MMKSKILWKANQKQKDNSNLFKYEKFISSKYKYLNIYFNNEIKNIMAG